MAGADTDVNGVLSFEEILDNHDLFVGSEVNLFCIHNRQLYVGVLFFLFLR